MNNKSKKHILYLYSELMGYQMPVLEELSYSYFSNIDVIHWDHKKKTSYQPKDIENVNYYKRSTFNDKELETFCQKVNYDIVVVSGWMDKGYVRVCGILKKKGAVIVTGCDNQWYGSLRQIIGQYYFKYFLKENYSFIWVPGPYQFEFAKRLGFGNKNIIFNGLTANNKLFRPKKSDLKTNKKFLYLGRFEESKGIRNLLRAWNSILDKHNWELDFIGSGSLKKLLTNEVNVRVVDFLQPEELACQLQEYSCLILPSIREPYALVIHEALCAGLPVIATNACGAVPVFLTSDYNGYAIETNDIDALSDAILKITKKSTEDLKIMKVNALKSSRIVNPQLAAASLMSVIN